MKKFRKTMVTLGTMLSIGIPSIVVVSCGSTTGSQTNLNRTLNTVSQNIDNSATIMRDLTTWMKQTGTPSYYGVSAVTNSWKVNSIKKISQKDQYIYYQASVSYYDDDSGKILNTTCTFDNDSTIPPIWNGNLLWQREITGASYDIDQQILTVSPTFKAKIYNSLGDSIKNSYWDLEKDIPTNDDGVLEMAPELLNTSFHINSLEPKQTGHIKVGFNYSTNVVLEAHSTGSLKASFYSVKFDESIYGGNSEWSYYADAFSWEFGTGGEIDTGHLDSSGNWAIDTNDNYAWTGSVTATPTNSRSDSGVRQRPIGIVYYNNKYDALSPSEARVLHVHNFTWKTALL